MTAKWEDRDRSSSSRRFRPDGGPTWGSTPPTPLGPCGVLGPPQAGIRVVGRGPTERLSRRPSQACGCYGFWWVGAASSGDGATLSWPNDGRKRLDGGPTGEWSNSHRPSASLQRWFAALPQARVRRSIAGFPAYPCQLWAPLGRDKGAEQIVHRGKMVGPRLRYAIQTRPQGASRGDVTCTYRAFRWQPRPSRGEARG
jgi:hypothetical protein